VWGALGGGGGALWPRGVVGGDGSLPVLVLLPCCPAASLRDSGRQSKMVFTSPPDVDSWLMAKASCLLSSRSWRIVVHNTDIDPVLRACFISGQGRCQCCASTVHGTVYGYTVQYVDTEHSSIQAVVDHIHGKNGTVQKAGG